MKEIFVFLGGAMFGGTVAFLSFCLFCGIRLRNEENSKNSINK